MKRQELADLLRSFAETECDEQRALAYHEAAQLLDRHEREIRSRDAEIALLQSEVGIKQRVIEGERGRAERAEACNLRLSQQIGRALFVMSRGPGGAPIAYEEGSLLYGIDQLCMRAERADQAVVVASEVGRTWAALFSRCAVAYGVDCDPAQISDAELKNRLRDFRARLPQICAFARVGRQEVEFDRLRKEHEATNARLAGELEATRKALVQLRERAENANDYDSDVGQALLGETPKEIEESMTLLALARHTRSALEAERARAEKAEGTLTRLRKEYEDLKGLSAANIDMAGAMLQLVKIMGCPDTEDIGTFAAKLIIDRDAERTRAEKAEQERDEAKELRAEKFVCERCEDEEQGGDTMNVLRARLADMEREAGELTHHLSNSEARRNTASQEIARLLQRLRILEPVVEAVRAMQICSCASDGCEHTTAVMLVQLPPRVLS